MSTILKISSLVVERLKKLQEYSTGRLLGLSDDESVIVVGLCLTAVNEIHIENNSPTNVNIILDNNIIENLPAGIKFCGAFKITTDNSSNIVDENLIESIEEIPVVLVIDPSTKKISATLYKNKKLETTNFVVFDHKELLNLIGYLRLTATFPISSDLELSCMESTLTQLENKLIEGEVGFQIQGTDIYILGGKEEFISGIKPEIKLKELLDIVNKSKNKQYESKINFMDVQMYLNYTQKNGLPQIAPYIKYIKKQFKHAEVHFSLDCLIVAPKACAVLSLHQLLVEGALRNFSLNKKNLLDQLDQGKIYQLEVPETCHFLPLELGHFVTIVYSPKQNAENTKKIREAFHKLFSLPMDKPLFRQSNAYDFLASSKNEKNLLLNPHESVTKSGVPDGEPYFVQGTYAYHHYMQDDMDDNGWGCAYRSLQTIYSWFKFQGYTNTRVPTHKEIQQCLVNIGDKPESFVGSKQWIGSTEVSFVLDTMLGVTSRIISISSGEEMTMKGGELSHHFKTQGTPIMIGGGVLAHTILGIDYNKKTGDIKFLILDPHFTGGEDLKIIINKGFCGWKGPEFWKKNAFYNMCLPLRPKCV